MKLTETTRQAAPIADQAAHSAIEASVSREIASLKAPARWVAEWSADRHEAELSSGLAAEFAASGRTLDQLEPEERDRLVAEAARTIGAQYRDWPTLRSIGFGTAAGTAIAYGFSMIPPGAAIAVGLLFSPLIGAAMTTFNNMCQPRAVRFFANQDEADARSNAADNAFAKQGEGVFHAQLRTYTGTQIAGILATKDAWLFLGELTRDMPSDPVEAADVMARAVILYRQAFAHVRLDPNHAMIMFQRLKKTFPDVEAFERVLERARELAPANGVSVADVEEHLRAYLKPEKLPARVGSPRARTPRATPRIDLPS